MFFRDDKNTYRNANSDITTVLLQRSLFMQKTNTRTQSLRVLLHICARHTHTSTHVYKIHRVVAVCWRRRYLFYLWKTNVIGFKHR